MKNRGSVNSRRLELNAPFLCAFYGSVPFGRTLARRRGLRIVRDDFFMLRSKSHLSFTPSLLLSKSKPHGRFAPR